MLVDKVSPAIVIEIQWWDGAHATQPKSFVWVENNDDDDLRASAQPRACEIPPPLVTICKESKMLTISHYAIFNKSKETVNDK